jgi:hypothetical protein
MSSVSTPILSLVIPILEVVFSGGKGLHSNVGGEFLSSSDIPIGSLKIPNIGFPFGWNVHSGSGTTIIHIGVSNIYGGPNNP